MIGRRDFIERALAAPRNNDLVAQFVKLFRDAAPDSRTAAGYQDCVACHFHGWILRFRLQQRNTANTNAAASTCSGVLTFKSYA
jgi:hypothetical protein